MTIEREEGLSRKFGGGRFGVGKFSMEQIMTTLSFLSRMSSSSYSFQPSRLRSSIISVVIERSNPEADNS